jgi:hypothetical protein
MGRRSLAWRSTRLAGGAIDTSAVAVLRGSLVRILRLRVPPRAAQPQRGPNGSRAVGIAGRWYGQGPPARSWAIDAIVKSVRGSRWQESQSGDREIGRQPRLILRNSGLPPSGDLFDRACAYIRERY